MTALQPIYRLLLVAICLSLLLVGCASGEIPTEADAEPVPLMIVCRVAYRSTVTVPIEEEAELVFGGENDEQTLAFEDLTLHAQYLAGERPPRERSLRLAVVDSVSGQELGAQLYQLSLTEAPRNEFRGGHGFTGLAYAYHPETGAELQYWCVAERDT
ncbi:MAG: hypothetical protein M3220_14315 [Chloroflexota bacterium]|nr:hypothetical protein [Chloroflexota bacterium]